MRGKKAKALRRHAEEACEINNMPWIALKSTKPWEVTRRIGVDAVGIVGKAYPRVLERCGRWYYQNIK